MSEINRGNNNTVKIQMFIQTLLILFLYRLILSHFPFTFVRFIALREAILREIVSQP